MKPSTSARSPLSPTHWPAEAFIWWQSALFALAVVVSSISFGIAFGIVWILFAGMGALKHMSLPFVFTLQVASYAPVLLLAVVVLPIIAKRSLRSLGWRWPTLPEIGIGLAGSIAMLVVSSAIAAFEENVLHTKVQETAVDLLKSAHGTMAVLFAILACVFAPIVEELTFRGFAFNALLRYMPVAWATVLSAALFGLAHASLTAFFPLAGAGVVLAIVYYRTGALSASMISHAGFNLIGVLGLYIFKN